MVVRFTNDVIPAEYIERLSDALNKQYGYYEAQGAVTTCSGLTVAIAASEASQYVVNGSLGAASTATTITLCAADACNPRIDIISIDASGVEAKNTGTPAATPVPPDIGACKLHLAQINIAAGQSALTACDITDMRQILQYDRLIVKAANETITCSASLQDDDCFSWTMAACQKYVFELHLDTIGNATCDFQYQWTVPCCTTVVRSAIYINNSGTLTLTDAQAETTGITMNGCTSSYEWGSFVTGANAGTAQLRWAQNSSGANSTGVRAGSWLRVTKA